MGRSDLFRIPWSLVIIWLFEVMRMPSMKNREKQIIQGAKGTDGGSYPEALLNTGSWHH